MGRKVAVAWHASFSIAAGVLYFFFVLPRWPELMGTTSHTLGTVLRIVTGAVIGLAAVLGQVLGHQDAPKNTARAMSSCSSRSAVRPSNRT